MNVQLSLDETYADVMPVRREVNDGGPTNPPLPCHVDISTGSSAE